MIELWSPTLLMIQKERNIQQMIGLWSPTLLKQGNPKQICMDHFSLKFSSCSTIFLEDSTTSCPHFETTLKSVALDFYFLIKEREGYLSYRIFDEHVYPLKHRTEEYIMYDPSETMIYKFIHTLFYVKSLKVAVAIIIMVYIPRLIWYSRIYICSATWRRIILGAILVAIKVRSNVPVCNKDLCRRFEKTTVDNLNKLEMNFLELINYDTNVSKSIYTVYYFRLRDLVYMYGLGLPICLLDTQRAWDLQLPVKAQRTRGRHTFRQIFVTHGAEDSQWRSRTGRQCDSCGRCSGFASTSAWQLLVQSKRDGFPF
uniref:cyclin-Y-like protein 2 n=1 Tax=Callithrix jacchus TaxID=9483 RepID=UPI0023DD2955|nr:cyclin-Y-like protein 2 [Callithrix jacchus]